MVEREVNNKRRQQLHDLLEAKKHALLAELRQFLEEQRTENVRMTFELAQDDGDKSVEDHARHVRSAIQGNKGDQLDAIEQALKSLPPEPTASVRSAAVTSHCSVLQFSRLASYCVACQEEIDGWLNTMRSRIRIAIHLGIPAMTICRMNSLGVRN